MTLHGFEEARLARISTHLQGYIERGDLVGISALIARGGEVVYAEHLGRLAKGGAALARDSLFRIYSMTKPITSVAALMLYEEGRFLLNDPVSKYLPYFKDTQVCVGSQDQDLKLEPQARQMTIQDLFTHTSGLSYGWFKEPVDGLYRSSGINPSSTALGEFVEQLASFPLVFQPGSHWRYSYSTDVLGHLVEVIAAESLDSFLDTRIFKPLGMTDTSFGVTGAGIDHLTTVYSPTATPAFGMDSSQLVAEAGIFPVDTPQQSRFVNPSIPVTGGAGGGGLVSTLSDYFKFASVLLGNGEANGVRLLGRKTVELMTTNHVPTTIRPLEIGGKPLPGVGFGLGVCVVEDIAATASLGSNGLYGWSGAAMTDFWVDPQENMIGIFMTQFMPSDFYPVANEFRVLSYQALLD